MTQTAQHTPGPWKFRARNLGGNLGQSYGVDLPNGGTIISCSNDDNAEANMRLVSTAPELLDALQSIVEILDPYSLDKDGREARAKALHAIWKALPRRATNRPGDEAAAMHEETGIDYERCLIMCNMD